MNQFPQKSILQQSVYRYEISPDIAEEFLLRTEQLLLEIADSFEAEVEESLQFVLGQLQEEFGRQVTASEQARFWMRDHLARVLAAAESPEEKREVENIFFAQIRDLLCDN